MEDIDDGLHIAVATIYERLTRREPWEVLVRHRNTETGEPTSRTTTVSDVREALLASVSAEFRKGLVDDYGGAHARASWLKP